MITLNDYLTTNGRHADRVEWVSPAVEENAIDLLAKVNAILADFGDNRNVASGFRDLDSNRKLKGASPFSRHITGQAIDLVDVTGSLGKWVVANPGKLITFGLWAEAPSATNGWVHFQSVAPPTGLRIFNP